MDRIFPFWPRWSLPAPATLLLLTTLDIEFDIYCLLKHWHFGVRRSDVWERKTSQGQVGISKEYR
jgi:hypothetical protein